METDYLEILWTAGPAKGYVDRIPAEWLTRGDGHYLPDGHEVVTPHKDRLRALCALNLEENFLHLDYREFSQNRSNGIVIGVLQLEFHDIDRKELAKINWKGEEEADFSNADSWCEWRRTSE